jgi:hypothetical protein
VYIASIENEDGNCKCRDFQNYNLIGRFSYLQPVTEEIIATTFKNAKSCWQV